MNKKDVVEVLKRKSFLSREKINRQIIELKEITCTLWTEDWYLEYVKKEKKSLQIHKKTVTPIKQWAKDKKKKHL